MHLYVSRRICYKKFSNLKIKQIKLIYKEIIYFMNDQWYNYQFILCYNRIILSFNLFKRFLDSRTIPIWSLFKYHIFSTLIGKWIERSLKWNYGECLIAHLLKTLHILHSSCF